MPESTEHVASSHHTAVQEFVRIASTSPGHPPAYQGPINPHPNSPQGGNRNYKGFGNTDSIIATDHAPPLGSVLDRWRPRTPAEILADLAGGSRHGSRPRPNAPTPTNSGHGTGAPPPPGAGHPQFGHALTVTAPAGGAHSFNIGAAPINPHMAAMLGIGTHSVVHAGNNGQSAHGSAPIANHGGNSGPPPNISGAFNLGTQLGFLGAQADPVRAGFLAANSTNLMLDGSAAALNARAAFLMRNASTASKAAALRGAATELSAVSSALGHTLGAVGVGMSVYSAGTSNNVVSRSLHIGNALVTTGLGVATAAGVETGGAAAVLGGAMIVTGASAEMFEIWEDTQRSIAGQNVALQGHGNGIGASFLSLYKSPLHLSNHLGTDPAKLYARLR